MKHVLWLLLGFVIGVGGCSDREQRPIAADDFGPVTLYRPAAAPKGLAVVLSDEAGWTADLVTLGGALASRDYLVAGLDSRHYLQRLRRDARRCLPVGLDLAHLAETVQQQNAIPQTQAPILVGIGHSAALVYAAAAQMPTQRFHAAVSIDFCPTLAIAQPLCTAKGLPLGRVGEASTLATVQQMGTPWFVFQHRQEQACPTDTANTFVKNVPNAKLTLVPAQPSQDGTTQEDWQPQFLALMQWLDPKIPRQAQSSATLSALPLIEQPVANGSEYLAVLLNGDGGWAAIDQGLASELGKRQVSTVGWDSLSYFWQPRTPAQAAADMERLLRHYLAAWNKQRVIFIGYSFGADVLPFLVNRLPADLRIRIDVLALLGLGTQASFAFHLTQWLGAAPSDAYPIAPELPRLQPMQVLCVFGAEETDSLCPTLLAPITVRKVAGDHHFHHDYSGLIAVILDLAFLSSLQP